MVFLTAADLLGAVCVVLGTNLSNPSSVYQPCLGLWLDHHLPPMHVSTCVGKAVLFGSSLPPQCCSFFERLSVLWV